jgi:hypothetical protein
MPAPVNLRALLAEGRHAHSRGRVPEAVALIESKPRLAVRLLELLWDDDPKVAQRAADVLERITARTTARISARGSARVSARVSHRPSQLERILIDTKDGLIGLLAETMLKKLRWNLALTIGSLPLTVPECRRVAAALYTYLDDPSSIVKTAALQGLADLTLHDPSTLPAVLDLLRIHGRSGTAAMRARSRILLKRLEAPKERPTGSPTSKAKH